MKELPLGWTDRGMAPGWMTPQVTPQTGQINRLKAENEGLKLTLIEVMARLERLEGQNGAESE